jgi:outer membrane protein TolC
MSVADAWIERVLREGRQDRRTAYGPSEAELEWERVPDLDGMDGFDAFGARLRFPLPIGGLRQRQAAEASARESRARASAEAVRVRLDARLGTELGRVRAAAARVDALREVEAELSGIEHSISERYRLGATSYLEYVDALTRLDDVRIQAVVARHAELRARLALAVTAGDASLFPLPEPIEEGVR